MATANRNRLSRIHPNKSKTDFSKVGGLSNHLKLLREIIILPLLYGDLYTHFNIKAPRGVIFYGPPGTGKTLVAGALANELNKEGNGKVTFFQRKGADILDKWVGESERKLRELFEKAARARPSVIFFDELDGLAPERSLKNDQVHSSVVATLLALMDGLENMAGVIVIGATNRIDTIDPALRRPGRFDRELYFPLPCVSARKEILQVHIRSWKCKPSQDFISRLAELTAGCCGSDLQAICAEAVLCCLKRKYPNINQKPKLNIEAESLKVEEQDFLLARLNIIPTAQRLGNCKMRRLSPFIKPLLQKQIDKIMRHVQVLLPHFTQMHKKFLVGNERYAGRLVLKGNMQQGLNTHVIPALLQNLEHLQSYILDVPTQYKDVISMAIQNLPSMLVLSRADDWWDIIDNNCQLSIVSMLEDIHAGLPVLLVATCTKDLPQMLQEYFYYNSSIVIQLEDPTSQEREKFFAPLFFSSKCLSLYKIWDNQYIKKRVCDGNDESSSDHKIKSMLKEKKHSGSGKKGSFMKPHMSLTKITHGKVTKKKKSKMHEKSKMINSLTSHRHIFHASDDDLKYTTSTAVTDLVNCNNIMHGRNGDEFLNTLYMNKSIKEEPGSDHCLVAHSGLAKDFYNDLHVKTDRNLDIIYTMWKRVSNLTTDGLPVLQLELLYDTILACIYVNKNNFEDVIQALESTLNNFESTNHKPGPSRGTM